MSTLKRFVQVNLHVKCSGTNLISNHNLCRLILSIVSYFSLLLKGTHNEYSQIASEFSKVAGFGWCFTNA